MPEAVLDASALVDLLLGNESGVAVRSRVTGHALHAPAHIDTEVLSAVGRLQRAGDLDDAAVEPLLTRLAAAPIHRHPVAELLLGAWSLHHQLRLADALYVALAASRALPLVTTDGRLRPVLGVEVVG